MVTKLESREVVTEADSQRYIAVLERLNVSVDPATSAHALGDSLNLARRYKLSAYDAAYLELSLRTGLPLATLDAGLAKAVTTAGHSLAPTDHEYPQAIRLRRSGLTALWPDRAMK